MKSTRISINDLKPNMKIASPVFTRNGVILLDKGSLLTENLIHKIKNMTTVDSISIFDDNNENDYSSYEVNANYKVTFRDPKNIKLDIKIEHTEMLLRESVYQMSTPHNRIANKVKFVSNFILDEFNDYSGVLENIMKLKSKENDVCRHSLNVASLCFMIGTWLKFSNDKIQKLIKSALLHDIGKIDILNENIIDLKASEISYCHPQLGYETIIDIDDFDEEIMSGILMHHEREDGSGYPFSLESKEIPEFAKIIAVADVFENLISKNQLNPFNALEILERDYMLKLDLNIMKLFIKKFSNYYIGSKVVLSTGEIGKIIHFSNNNIKTPLVMVGNSFIDLSLIKNITIQDFAF